MRILEKYKNLVVKYSPIIISLKTKFFYDQDKNKTTIEDVRHEKLLYGLELSTYKGAFT